MKTWQRFIDTVEFKKTDHVPVAFLGTPRFFASLSGINLFECLHNPYKLMESEYMAFQKLPEVTFIPGYWPDYGLGIYSAFGCRIYWSKDSMPYILQPVIKTDSDIAALTLPDPKHEGFLPWYLRNLDIFKTEGKSSNNHRFIWSEGQGEIAAALWGMQELMVSFYEKPELVKELFNKLTDFIIAWLEAQLEIIDEAEGILFCDDISGLVSKEHYEEFLFPYHRQIRERFKNYIIVFHCDTKSDHILEPLIKLGIDIFHLGPTTDLVNAKKRMANKVCLMGNIDPVEIMQSNDVEIVKKSAEECLKNAMSDGGFILSVGGGLNENTSEENIRAIIEVAQEK